MTKTDVSTRRNSERDADIVTRYQAGESLSSIGQFYHLSHEWVRQIILKSDGKLRRSGNPNVKSNRTKFLGVEVSHDVKEALKAEAKRRGLSMSSLTSDTLQAMLDTLHQEQVNVK